MEAMIFKRDNLKLGIILGLIGPILGLLVIYFIKFSEISFGEFLQRRKRLRTCTGIFF